MAVLTGLNAFYGNFYIFRANKILKKKNLIKFVKNGGRKLYKYIYLFYVKIIIHYYMKYKKINKYFMSFSKSIIIKLYIKLISDI